MKYCIDSTKDLVNNTLSIEGVFGIKNIMYIANETQQKLICSSFQKANVSVATGSTSTVITIPTEVCQLQDGDDITFIIDDFKSSQDMIDEVKAGVTDVEDKVDDITETLGQTKTTVDATKTKVDTIDTNTASTKSTVEAILANLGAKAAADLTVRELLTAIKTDALTTTQLNALKTDILSVVSKEATLGTAADGTTEATVFGKIAALKAAVLAIDTKLGVDSDSKTLFERILEIVNLVGTFAYGFTIEANEDGEDTYTLVIDESAFVEGTTLNIA